ncbi:MAG: class II aldolase/adducin family protein [Betaproteobacteria bacterium]|nr:class II aldolase/adducin family protein [Betaproteobacteria bacterium]
MSATGLTPGTAGNLSCRQHIETGEGSCEGFLITPSGIPYAALEPGDIVFLPFDTEGEEAGKYGNRRKPSSEWRIHRDLYQSRPEAGAVLHAHSLFATALACLRGDIPPFHYMIARFGGSTVRCAPYATFGTQPLSEAALGALRDRRACLLANHGMLVFGHDCAHALDLALELETLCAQYWHARQLGTPALLDSEEMARVLEKFSSYGQQNP